MTDAATPALKRAEDLFKGLVWDNLVSAGLTALFSAVPWLAVWPLGPLIRFAVGKFSSVLFEALRLVLDLQVIAFKNDAARKEFDTAAVKLKLLERDFGLDSEQYKKAREDAKAELAKFVRFGATQ